MGRGSYRHRGGRQSFAQQQASLAALSAAQIPSNSSRTVNIPTTFVAQLGCCPYTKRTLPLQIPDDLDGYDIRDSEWKEFAERFNEMNEENKPDMCGMNCYAIFAGLLILPLFCFYCAMKCCVMNPLAKLKAEYLALLDEFNERWKGRGFQVEQRDTLVQVGGCCVGEQPSNYMCYMAFVKDRGAPRAGKKLSASASETPDVSGAPSASGASGDGQFCSNCGKALKTNARFCAKCGHKAD